jgi:hypothetical protein
MTVTDRKATGIQTSSFTLPYILKITKIRYNNGPSQQLVDLRHFIEPFDQLEDSINIMTGKAGPGIICSIYSQGKSQTL